MDAGKCTAGGNRDGLASQPGRVKILLVASCYWNQDEIRPDGPLGSNSDFTFSLHEVPWCSHDTVGH